MTTTPPNDGNILTVATIIKALMTSAAKAELGAIYLNTKEAAVYLCQTLTKMSHLQPQTTIQTNKLTLKGKINQKYSPNKQR
jgi:hypothetical protein